MNVTKNLTHRESLGYWLNEAGLVGKGVEIGVAHAQFSSRILSTWKGQELYMVDPWVSYPEYLESHVHVNFEDWYQAAVKLSQDDPRAKVVRKFSKEAAEDFKNGELDFAYIDGNHDYAHVLSDLDSWTPKVKVGGLVGGHDAYTDLENGAWCSVDKAVTRWCKERNIVFSVLPCTSWFFIKG